MQRTCDRPTVHEAPGPTATVGSRTEVLARQGQETRIAPFFCRVAGQKCLLLLKDATSSCRSLPCAARASQLASLYFLAYCVCRLIVLYDLHGELRRQRATPGHRRPPSVHNNTLFRTYCNASRLRDWALRGRGRRTGGVFDLESTLGRGLGVKRDLELALKSVKNLRCAESST